MKYRICYEKKGALIFISHLDVQKAFQRAFRRTDIRLSLSQGFHPHPKMTYSPPLPLFVSSEAEYLDVALDTFFTEEEIFEKLNAALPRDMKAKWVKMLNDSDPSLTELLLWGQYDFTLRRAGGFSHSDALALEAFFEQHETLLIEKKNKKGETVEKDIRPLVRALAACVDELGDLNFTALLSMKNDSLLNPNLFLEVILTQVPACSGAEALSVVKSQIIS